ncbi:hypothetical protein A0J61_01264 [Choanephora cucurbitarum]|uniref:Uncharacterized protein n=1 Tax=Choanephora cucurbitarum TaxID=101091 RepID=A0A1C7NT48_9FUNG|nr:hypothetical protein A0J61_01264 [Choanephora cucurbitarum]
MEYTKANGVTANTKTKTTSSKASSRFIGRVASIPIIQDSMLTAQSIANKTSIGRYALSTATSSYEYALNNPHVQTYYQQYLQPHATKVDELGCGYLDVIESKVPALKKPTSEIIPYHVIKLRAGSAIENVTHPAQLVIQSVNDQLTKAVDRFEGVVNTYLPPTEEEGKVEKETNIGSNQVKRAYGVLNKASHRVVVRSTAQIPKSREDMTRLAENNTTVQNMYEQLRLIQEAVVQSVVVYKQAAEERLPTFVVARAHATTEYVSQVMTSIQTQIGKLNTTETSGWAQQRFQALLEATQQQIDLVRSELARTDINYVDKFKHVANTIQDQMMPALENLCSQLLLLKEKIQQELPQLGFQHQKTKSQ